MLYGVWGEAYGSENMSNTSKAQQARMNNEPAVTALATRLRKGVKAAVKDLQAILISASGHGIKHETLTRIQGSFITGDVKVMADGIEGTYTGKQPRNNVPRGESSNLAWLMHIIDGIENPRTRSNSRAISKDAFKAMKVRNGGHIPDGLSVKEAITQGFLSEDGRAIKGDPTPAPTPAPMADAPPADFEKLTAEQKEDFFQAWQAKNSA